jgi:putative hemolysin
LPPRVALDIEYINNILNQTNMQEFQANAPISRETAKSRLSYAKDDDPKFKRFIIKTIETITGRPKIEKLYTEMKEMDLTPQSIWRIALEKLQVYPHFSEEQLAKIPKEGPIIFVANHPFGVIDGLLFGLIASKVRDSFGILVNEVLCTEEMFMPYFMPIDFRETREAMQTIIDTRNKCMERLGNGESIAIFPSGGVATARRPFGKVQDLEWKLFAVKMIQKSKATVVPIFFHGQNSPIFQLASKINQNLRLSLLLHEVRNKMGRHIGISIGDPIPYETLAQEYPKANDMVAHLQKATWELENDPYYSGFRKKRKGKKLAKQEAKNKK